MYVRVVLAILLLSASTAFAQPVGELNRLGWHEATGAIWSMGQFGGVGPKVKVQLGGPNLFEIFVSLRYAGLATYATSQYTGLPFDLAAARLVDGLVVSDGEASLALWSMLLDHGYVTSPVAGPQAKLYLHCPESYSEACAADAVKHQRTVVSTGPLLAAKFAEGKIEVEAWAGKSSIDRVELWSHNRVIATEAVPAGKGQRFSGKLAWTPAAAGDWVAVRVIAGNEWALSSAFLSEGYKPAPPITTHLKMVFPEIASQQQAGALATVFDFSLGVPGVKQLQEIEMERNEIELDAPPTAMVRIELADGRMIDTSLYEASGVRALLEDAPASTGWSLYEEVLRRLKRISIESRF